jgi:hypothetical protein
VAAVILTLGFLCGGTAALDMDFHWHLALGQDLVANGFPSSEPFSHLPAGVPDRQAWLSDAAVAVLDRIGGIALVRVACGAVFAAGCLSVWRLARRRAMSLAVALLPVALYVALCMARLRVRPDLFTLALVPLFVEMLERAPSWRRSLDLLLVSALWANLHPASLIAGLLALAQAWPPTRHRLVNAVAAWLGLCLTPDGIRGLLRYTADTTPLRPLIPEWQRLWERPFAEFGPEWAVVLGLLVLCAWAVVARTRGRSLRGRHARSIARDALGPPASAGFEAGFEVREAARALLGLALAASAVRFLFALVMPALWAIRVIDPVVAPRALLRTGVFAIALAATVAFPIARLADVGRGLRAAGGSFLGPEPPGFPKAAAEFLAASELSGNLAHSARWGGYLAWKLRPRFKTATDGRVTHFGADLAREWSDGIDSPAREEIFAKRGIDLVVVPRHLLATFLDDQPYEVIHADPLAAVLLRLEGPNQAENVRILQAAAKKKRR